jgi:hypothetical protein
MLAQALSDRVRRVGRTAGDLWHAARHPRQSLEDTRAAAKIFRDLCEGGLVVSTAFPTAEQIARVKAAPAPGATGDAEDGAAATQALGAILADANVRGAAAGAAEPIALRTVLQADGAVTLLIDGGLAAGDPRLLRALVQVHAGAVRDALKPLVRAQAIATALRASVRFAVPTVALLGGSAATWLADLATGLIWATLSAAATGGLLFAARWALETYLRHKARSLLQR